MRAYLSNDVGAWIALKLISVSLATSWSGIDERIAPRHIYDGGREVTVSKKIVHGLVLECIPHEHDKVRTHISRADIVTPLHARMQAKVMKGFTKNRDALDFAGSSVPSVLIKECPRVGSLGLKRVLSEIARPSGTENRACRLLNERILLEVSNITDRRRGLLPAGKFRGDDR